jgi:thioredoxin 1
MQSISQLDRKTFFSDTLHNNPGYVVINFYADWCRPCNAIKDTLHTLVETLPNTVHFYNLNVDINANLYAFFKQKKMLNGIPTILVFKKDNISFVPDHSVVGANIAEINNIFNLFSSTMN